MKSAGARPKVYCSIYSGARRRPVRWEGEGGVERPKHRVGERVRAQITWRKPCANTIPAHVYPRQEIQR